MPFINSKENYEIKKLTFELINLDEMAKYECKFNNSNRYY